MERGFAIVRDRGQQCFRERLFRQTPRRNYRENHDIEIERHIRRFRKSLPRPRTLRNRRHARACRARLRRAQKTGKINICFNKKPWKTEFPRLFCASKTAAFKGGERPINRRDSLYARNADFQTLSSASPSASDARSKAVFYRRLPPNGKRPARFALTKSAAAEHAKPSISAHSAGSGMETIQ